MEELVKQAKMGNEEAFTQLIIQMQCEMFRIAQTRLKNIDDANDAIQQTNLYAYKNLRQLKEDKYFKTWIIKILINECNKVYKVKKYNQENSYEIIRNTLVSPDETEEIINFKFLCDNLNKEDGTIILLYYMEKYTDKEIGEILNMKENTVRTKRNRIKNKIKKFYEEYGRI